MQDLLIPFGTILIAELLDKSQLSILLLSSKTKQSLVLLLGVMLAFLIVDGTAIFLGSWIPTLLPEKLVTTLAAVSFFLFGMMALRSKPEDVDQVTTHRNIFFTGFLLVFLAEWGDKTQIAAALFATQYQPVLVLIGVMAALLLLSLLAIYLGHILSSKIERRILTRVTGVLFLLLGITFLFF